MRNAAGGCELGPPMASIKRNFHGIEIKRISKDLYKQFTGPYI